ncbi:glycoside hydrolase family 99-like domain-containing protein [Terricaulis silvestris]|uniref:Glycosyltransferase EpsH n=1 Tax=Terricaulis silvestris TaxID=2686094 RepID=A0A6I6MT78_9CAUL|nr:glycoside hydrolase family 99-like domain-containing protein [Terricaulis silvestris]QGZ96558.1 Putative glycosyltransferase EpsH [Terricaulis silvestris]
MSSGTSIIAVLGMHRSGTSAISRGLTTLGVDLGDNLLGPSVGDNDKGFWEDADLTAFNDGILARLGSSYDSLAPLDGEDLNAALRAERDAARGLLSSKLNSGATFGFKDPRTSILLAFWRPVFSNLSLDDRYVIALRNPLEVAASLQRRDGFQPPRSLLLWTKHMLRALIDTRGRPRVIISYAAMLEHPKEQLTRLADALGLPKPDKKKLADYEGNFLESSLRRFSLPDTEVERSTDAPACLPELYRIASMLAAGATLSTSQEDALDRMWRDYEALWPVLRYMDTTERRDQARDRDIAEWSMHARQLEAALAESAAKASALEGLLAEVRSQSEKRDAAFERLTKDAMGVSERLGEARAVLAERERALGEMTNTLASVQHVVEERARAIDEWSTHARQLEAALEAQKRRDEARDRDIDEWSTHARQLEAALGAQKRRDEARDRAIDEWSTHARQLEAALDHERSDVAAMRRSSSWRITAPLRVLTNAVRRPVTTARASASLAARAVWRLLPMNGPQKQALRDRLFRGAPQVFERTATYRAWAQTKDVPSLPATTATAGEPRTSTYVDLTASAPVTDARARAIAFYLPQFHAIAENNAWWGEGFTEWTNVRSAVPHFKGHDQPRVPGELGYYDLVQDQDVRRRQAELAKLHGVEAFCFYAYWFAGKRLLEQPISAFADDPNLDFPFLLCWANENWSRRWDGLDQEILIAQDHSPTDDLAFIKWIAGYMRNPRYFRIDARPVLLVYRPALLPSARETAARWREWCRKNGVGEIYLAYTQSFEITDPAEYGFDAAIEFPPNNMGLTLIDAEPLSADYDGKVYDWTVLARRSEAYQAPAYKLFRGVNPSWDNTARRKNKGTVLLSSSPEAYGRWLTNAVEETRQRVSNPEERLVFINAWNEWAEGAYLEPDQTYGYAYLEATRQALAPPTKRVVVVVHDLLMHGAQFLALNMARTLRERFGYEIATITCGEGGLAPQFESIGKLLYVTPETGERVARALAREGYSTALVNSAAAGWMTEHLDRAGLECVALIHELPKIIADMKLENGVRAMNKHARAVIFPSTVVRDRVGAALDLTWQDARILPQGLFKRDCKGDPDEKDAARRRLQERLDLPANARIVLGVGYGDRRKGVDIFVRWVLALIATRDDAHAIWVGELREEMHQACAPLLAEAGPAARRIKFLGFTPDLTDLYAGADLYALSSREDPFPSTALDALASAAPVIMVSGAGGVEDLVEKGCVVALPSDSALAFAEAAGRLLGDDALRGRMGLIGRDLIRSEFGFASYVGEVLRAAGDAIPRVSVIVPNYNYARYLEQRLCSILAQTLPPHEIIFLDDASNDDSLDAAARLLATTDIGYKIVPNKQNSGDVFAQWRKGVEQASGDYVWIAEADDWAAPEFLANATAGFSDPEVVLSYTQSKQIDQRGDVMASDYLQYVSELGMARWATGYVSEGAREIVDALAVKNTIPNVSAVVFARSTLGAVLNRWRAEIAKYRVAGDWCVYVNVLRDGKAYYSPLALNNHRRHSDSVTIARFGLNELAEIARMQAFIAAEFDVPPATKVMAAAYLDRLVKQFDLSQKFPARDIEAVMAEARR